MTPSPRRTQLIAGSGRPFCRGLRHASRVERWSADLTASLLALFVLTSLVPLIFNVPPFPPIVLRFDGDCTSTRDPPGNSAPFSEPPGPLPYLRQLRLRGRFSLWSEPFFECVASCGKLLKGYLAKPSSAHFCFSYPLWVAFLSVRSLRGPCLLSRYAIFLTLKDSQRFYPIALSGFDDVLGFAVTQRPAWPRIFTLGPPRATLKEMKRMG